MEEFSMYYFKRRASILFIVLVSMSQMKAQGNCLLYPAESGERIACELCYRAIEYEQGSKESQLLFDKAIEIGPKYAWAYYQKSVPFLKRGFFAEGVELINKAIELEPENYLYYRAYWYFYHRSYDYCIRDLEELYSKHKVSYCTTPGGELEMRVLLALAYAQTGNVTKGIESISDLMEFYKKQPYLVGNYDHYCLGLLYYKDGQLDLAKSEFESQLQIDDSFADTYYFLGMIKNQKDEKHLARNLFEIALTKMNGENGGNSPNLFTEFNINKEDVMRMLGA